MYSRRWIDDRRARKCGDVDVYRGRLRTADRDRDGMPTGVAGLRFYRRMDVCCFGAAMAPFGQRRMRVLVGCRPVVMVRVIVACVLVHVEQRARGRRDSQRVGEHESDEPAHGFSLLRAAASACEVK